MPPYNRTAARRAASLAGSLPAANITRPPEVEGALRAHRAAREMTLPPAPAPGQLVNGAIWDAARQALTDAARTGNLTLDPRALYAARLAEADARDLQTLARAAREQADTALAEAVDQHADTLTAAVQGRHGEVVGELAALGRRLPPGVTDAAALEAGGELRADYLRCRDMAAELAALRELLWMIRAEPYGSPPGDRERCIAYCRSEYLLENRRDFADAPFGSLAFYLKLVREVAAADCWCPTVSEVESRCTEVREAARLARLEHADAARRGGA